MRICVTGAAGFIGANLVARLKAQGHQVRAVDVKETPERAHLYEQADEFYKADLRYSYEAHTALAGCDRVYHLAADHGGAGYFHGEWDFKAALNNEAIDRNILTMAVRHETPRLFFASSACTYDTATQGRGAKPLKESDWYRGGKAEALYGERKRMSTLFFEGAREHGHDFRSGLFHTIYGPTQDTEEPRAKFPTAICRKILDAKNARGLAVDTGQIDEADKPRVEIWGDGTQVRTFLYIEDALDRIQAVMEKPYSGPVNIGSDEEVTIQGCAEWAAEAAGVTPEWVYTDGPTGVAHRSADNTVWNDRYGEGELTSARDGFHKLMAWMKDRSAVAA